MTLLQFWLLRGCLVATAGLCLIFGGLTIRQGVRATRTGNVDKAIRGPAAVDIGCQAISFGISVFLFGFALHSFLFTF